MKRAFLSLSLALALILLVGAQPAPALDRATTQKIMTSVVQLIATDEGRGGRLLPKWSGSGTIVSPDGLILTNCHVAMPRAMWGPEFDYDHLIVALTIRSDEPPRPTYIAEVVQYDPDLDLAVVRVVQNLDGSPVDPAGLNLPTVPLGNSDALEIGDALFIFGYPAIGGETITLTTGAVSGFSSEKGVKGRAWIKTDATIAGGNSGGTAVNEQGELVGVPTQGGAGSAEEIVDCRYIADTNGDGKIDEHDTCVPMGGFINALRPVNLAKLLIMAATQGLGPEPLPMPTPEPTPSPAGPEVSRLFFAPAINEAEQPVTVVQSLPSGAEDLYLFFDYKGFQDGASWHPVLTHEGEEEKNVWPLSNWSGGPQGTWWLSVHNEPLAEGHYEITLLYAGQEIGSAAIDVGAPEEGPAFRNLVFSGGGEEGYTLPAGIQKVTASFDYNSMAPETSWTYTWYQEGKKLASGQGEPLEGDGEATLLLTSGQGLRKGTYRLELYLEDRLAATADFALTAEGGGPLFGPITFAEGVDRDGGPLRPGTTFESGLSELYGFFDYQGMQDGWTWTRRWYLDGEAVVEGEDAWEGGESGENFWVKIFTKRGTLPEGEYQLDLLVEGDLVQSATCEIVGKFSRPTPTPMPPERMVEVYGRITDADTGEGIPGALFLVLQPGITTHDFQWTQEEVFSWGEADRNGDYRLSAPLVRGETYSMIVGARGYIPVGEDGVEVPEDLESPYRLDVVLQKAR